VALKTVAYRIEVGTKSVPLAFVRNRKARRYILRMLPEGAARVTIPRGGTVEHALEFARKNSAWLQGQLAQTPAEWRHGTEVLLRGIAHPLQISPGERGERGLRVTLGGWQFEVVEVAERGGLRAGIEARLRSLAVGELIPRTYEIARQLGLEVLSVQVRNQRSRWGSCSVRRRICLNWRLIQAPEFVRDYIIIHELIHLKEMNHSAKFWSHVAAACPNYLEAERWLRKSAGLLR